MRPDEGVPVRTVSVESSSGANRGFLLVQVPPSPRAPHMVDGRYCGRADRTNRPLSNAEVIRLHEQQMAAQRDILADAHRALSDFVGDRRYPPPAMLLLAEPVPTPNEPLVALTESPTWDATLLELLRAAAIHEHQQFAPHPG
jgi:hypothetical protein